MNETGSFFMKNYFEIKVSYYRSSAKLGVDFRSDWALSWGRSVSTRINFFT